MSSAIALVHLADFLAVGGQAMRAGGVPSMSSLQSPPNSWPQQPSAQEPGSIYQAAVANAAAAHLLDWDDVMLGVPTHPGCIIWPVLLACAPAETSLRSLIAAFEEGVGVAAELAGVLGVQHYSRGWHATATIGRMAAAYAAALVRYQHSGRAWVAMQLAAITGNGFIDVFGTSVKSIQVGLAAGAAAHSALLAGQVEDMPDVLVPHSSLGRVLGVVRAPARRESYASADALAGLRIKEFPCCYFAHAPVLAALELRSDAMVESGERVVVKVSEAAARICKVVRPATIDEARFSLPYLLASVLEGFSDGALGLIDGSVLSSAAIARRAEDIVVEANSALEGMAAVVRVGDRHCAVNLEGAQPPSSGQSVLDKAGALSEAERDLIALCLNPDPSVRESFLNSPVSRLYSPSIFPQPKRSEPNK